MRKKLPESEKKTKISASVDKEVHDMLEQYMEENGYKNKSKLIEHWIKKELKKDE